MIGTLLKPLVFVGRSFNKAANLYFAGQISWWAYKEVRKMQKEKLKADELRTRFVSEYVSEFEKEPSEQEEILKDKAKAIPIINLINIKFIP